MGPRLVSDRDLGFDSQWWSGTFSLNIVMPGHRSLIIHNPWFYNGKHRDVTILPWLSSYHLPRRYWVGWWSYWHLTACTPCVCCRSWSGSVHTVPKQHLVNTIWVRKDRTFGKLSISMTGRHYTLSHVENNRNVSAYSGRRCLLLCAQLACFLTRLKKNTRIYA